MTGSGVNLKYQEYLATNKVVPPLSQVEFVLKDTKILLHKLMTTRTIASESPKDPLQASLPAQQHSDAGNGRGAGGPPATAGGDGSRLAPRVDRKAETIEATNTNAVLATQQRTEQRKEERDALLAAGDATTIRAAIAKLFVGACWSFLLGWCRWLCWRCCT